MHTGNLFYNYGSSKIIEFLDEMEILEVGSMDFHEVGCEGFWIDTLGTEVNTCKQIQLMLGIMFYLQHTRTLWTALPYHYVLN